MAAERGTGGALEHLTFVGDSMLLVLPVGGAIIGMGTMAFAGAGWGGVGIIIGAVLAPMGTLLVAWSLRGRPVNRDMMMAISASTIVVLAVAGALYALVVMKGLDQTAGFRAFALALLALEGAVAMALAVDGIMDLAKKHAHKGLDVIRLVALALVAGMLAIFWANPDIGELLVVVIPLGLAGGLTGLIGDAVMTMRDRAATSPGAGTPATQ